MAPKTRSADSPPATPVDSPDPSSQQSSPVPAHDTLSLVLEEMALINARMDAQRADAIAIVVEADVADPTVPLLQ
jgi:hypothetical protein